ncbi:Coatomer subunit zeta-1 [Acorus calamus]|uniref:Coatomer subunit zeta n=1 Tax=Acorus calamus TaxID=4465 RepID=A0AAV9FF79_ACOCL|nr:Coatomer subunit zeta-1 [Acorus calamus]
MESFPTIKNILLLDSEGKRVAVKYYSDDWPTLDAKLSFEKSIFSKTMKTNARTEAEITMFDDYIVVYKFVQDLHFFVTGGSEENELILASVLQGFYDAIGLLLRNSVDKRTALENLDLILLCIDEIVDGGIILETDGSAIAGKVASNGIDGGASLSEQVIPSLGNLIFASWFYLYRLFVLRVIHVHKTTQFPHCRPSVKRWPQRGSTLQDLS